MHTSFFFLSSSSELLLWRIADKDIEVASVINLSEASGRVAAGLFMTEG